MQASEVIAASRFTVLVRLHRSLRSSRGTLPTSGTARFSSPLSVDDFVKKTQYTYYTHAALEKAQQSVSNFAKKEGLTGHARSVDIRFDTDFK